MNGRCCIFILTFLIILVCSNAEKPNSHKLVKRQVPRTSNQRNFPLSRRRQFPPPEELESSEESEEDSYEDLPPVRRFRGRQQPSEEEDVSDDYHYTESPKATIPPTTTTTKAPSRSGFNRFGGRPRFGSGLSTARPPVISSTTSTTQKPTPGSSRSRSRLSPVPAQRIDVTTQIVNRPPPPRTPNRTPARSNRDEEKSTSERSNVPAARRIGGNRGGARGRYRTRTSTTTTTTTTTTAAPEEEYYYYYYDDDQGPKQALATTTSTTTTTTTPKPSLPRRVSIGSRKPALKVTSARSPVKFDPESQFAPPPDDAPVTLPPKSTKKFTTSTTEAPGPGGIPSYLRGKYKQRPDGRFIDYMKDPNRPRELKGFDLTEYPFYIRVPEDIDFDCEDKKDGYYASIPHHCQLFHYCFAGARYDFLCANYTLYDQTTFTCRFANNVDCPSSEKYYYRNDDLWKVTTTTTKPPEELKRKKAPAKDHDYEEDDEYYDEDYYEDEEEEKRRRRPSRRPRNRRRKNRKQESDSA